MRLKNRRRFICCAGLIALGSSSAFSEVGRTSMFLDERQVVAARSFGQAISQVDWSNPNEQVARESIEAYIQPYGWEFRFFEVMQPTKEIPRRMDAELVVPRCVGAATWASALGMPSKVTLTRTEQLAREMRPEMIEKLVRGEEKFFGQVSVMHYPILTQPKYGMDIHGVNDCFSAVQISVLPE